MVVEPGHLARGVQAGYGHAVGAQHARRCRSSPAIGEREVRRHGETIERRCLGRIRPVRLRWLDTCCALVVHDGRVELGLAVAGRVELFHGFFELLQIQAQLLGQFPDGIGLLRRYVGRFVGPTAPELLDDGESVMKYDFWFW